MTNQEGGTSEEDPSDVPPDVDQNSYDEMLSGLEGIGEAQEPRSEDQELWNTQIFQAELERIGEKSQREPENDETWKDQIQDTEYDRAVEDNIGRRQDREERKKFASRVFWLVSTWLTFVATILVLHGAEDSRFSLSDAALLGLLGTATTTVIGLFATVLGYLFWPRKRD